jgi:hypothetical protein
VGAHVVEHRRYLPFVLVRERRPRRLLAVAQRGVENSCLIYFVRVTQCALEELDPPAKPTYPQWMSLHSIPRRVALFKSFVRTGFAGVVKYCHVAAAQEIARL